MDGPGSSAFQRLGGDLIVGLSVVYMGLVLWQWIDPDFDPADLVANARGWLSERLQRWEAFNRTLAAIRDLPERETP
jgi:hypothetical protein